MSDAQIEAYSQGDFALSSEDVIPVIKAAGPEGLTDRDVADRLISGELPFDERYSIQQECVKICGDLYYDGYADRVKRRQIVNGEVKIRSFYTMREKRGEPRERPGEKKVREATDQLRAQLAQALARADRVEADNKVLYAYIEGLTSPSTGG